MGLLAEALGPPAPLEERSIHILLVEKSVEGEGHVGTILLSSGYRVRPSSFLVDDASVPGRWKHGL